jgi:UPF0755 protein
MGSRSNINNIFKNKNIADFRISKTEIYISTAVFGFLLGLMLFIFFTPNYYKQKSPVEFIIPAGSSLTSVIDSLYAQEIINNKAAMHVAAFIFGVEKNIKAGTYKIPNGQSYYNLLDLFLSGSPEKQIMVTIPEGIWQPKLAELLSEELLLNKDKIMDLSKDKKFLKELGIDANNIEGYLLAETFYFFEDVDEKEALSKLKYEMDKLFSPEEIDTRMKILGRTKHEILTIASIIDGESNIVSEFKRISGVYYNRLKKGWRLQADPTIQYLKRHKRSRNKIYYKDLEIDSPYNTYMYAGLPPGPINNPGKDAVMAALYPEEHNYYYFVADGNGGHVFAKTSTEHNRNVRAYRKWRSSQ